MIFLLPISRCSYYFFFFLFFSLFYHLNRTTHKSESKKHFIWTKRRLKEWCGYLVPECLTLSKTITNVWYNTHSVLREKKIKKLNRKLLHSNSLFPLSNALIVGIVPFTISKLVSFFIFIVIISILSFWLLFLFSQFWHCQKCKHHFLFSSFIFFFYFLWLLLLYGDFLRFLCNHSHIDTSTTKIQSK